MRTFVAVEVSSIAIAKLQKEILPSTGWDPRDVKPVEPHNFHFTLIFLGEVSDHDVDRIKEHLAGFQFESFTITYTGIGAFPNPAHARVIWVGVDQEGVQKLTALANDVIAKMSELGFKADKPFSAHMTFLRAKGRPLRATEISSKYQGRTFGSDRIDKIHLKKSELTPSGPIYLSVYTVEAKK
ncbi:MAG TPA: RNA 2',3'-cyclic phosphodiesterase [Nitrososphaera sp.]|jgi:2'-5' RNA ligase|nr:RNA 2',3'-cyclic phosphodiesterase [Nitrososphaera sp.]